MIRTLVYRDNKLAAHNPPPETLPALRAEPGVLLWIDLDQPTEEETHFVLEKVFSFHPLAIEDCVTDSPSPKLEDYDEYLYLVMHAVDYSRQEHFTTTEFDLFLGRNFLVTFHRQPLRPVQAALERYLRAPQTPIRGPDRFAHGILDLMVEAYRPALEDLRADLEKVEQSVLENVSAEELFPKVVALRKELSKLRQVVRPQREIASELAQGKHRLIRSLLIPYLRDLSEELARIEAEATAWSEQLILSFRVYLNKSGSEANQGIRVLTSLTALTIPTFIVGGWYGMNFSGMRELHSPYGYLVAAVLTATATLGMLWFIRRRKWL